MNLQKVFSLFERGDVDHMLKANPKAIAFLFVIAFVLLSTILFQNQKISSVQEAEKRIDIFMSKWLALFDYIEVKQKEIFYDLEKNGALTVEGYFDPRVLSFTYIAREIQHKYEEIEKEKGEIPYRYRLAATTPRNSVNQATQHEEKILERFRNNEIEKFTEYIHRDNEKFYVSYKPISRTDKSCMRCHSTPDVAPKGLVERYGRHAGFNVSLGVIRAMIVMEIPFNEIEEEAFNHYIINMVIMLIVFTVFYIILVTILKKEGLLTQTNEELKLEIDERYKKEKLILEKNSELNKALSKVKLLSGFLPICASCKNIRDDKGYWNQIESYIKDHSMAEFSHSICPVCIKKLYPEFKKKDDR